eukprot:1193358-Prorocentrum_minimum.AAC.2
MPGIFSHLPDALLCEACAAGEVELRQRRQRGVVQPRQQRVVRHLGDLPFKVVSEHVSQVV